ncbi:MAG: hypothetical protein LUC49_04955 [Prevotella sp.]|nr:hypothetical protein [Prevotella sp.]
MKTNISIQFTLSIPQLEYLADGSYKINRMAMFLHLCKCAALQDTPSRQAGNKGTLRIGQVEKSIKQLASEWRCDAKTAAKVINAMNRLGILTTASNHITSVHAIHPVAAWIVDNVRIRNPHFSPSYNPATLTYGTFASTSCAGMFTSQSGENNADIDTDADKRSSKKKTSTSEQGVPVPTVFAIEQYSVVTDESSATANVPNIAASSTSGQAGQVASNEQTSSPATCLDEPMSACCKEVDTANPLPVPPETSPAENRSDIREVNPIT